MILLPLVSLIILPILARAQVGPVPTNVPLNIVDFQKNVFDLTNGKPNAPVQGLDHRVGDPAQQVCQKNRKHTIWTGMPMSPQVSPSGHREDDSAQEPVIMDYTPDRLTRVIRGDQC
ncbi:hypothetical protein C8F04DRAFT_1182308 [Mycena alexandri]|uniref:Uncharacterized protein n=1 Tax=Mycena alexandri TaxID=1745969 RepID=A0AAD6SX14_9AGAR|nr:hypothetical protein C8F04DRAFT_1182308 [Mycena alexandri]